MINYSQNQTQQVANPPFTAPNAYPMKNDRPAPPTPPPPVTAVETMSKGHGFWRGCCAGWCCYCCLEACF